MRLRLRGVGEEPRRLDDDVDAEILPGQLRRIAFLQDLDLAAVDDDRVGGRAHLAGERAVVRVVLEEQRVHLRIGEVVDRDDFEIGMPLEKRLQELTADPTEAVDGDVSVHLDLPVRR